ncbi:MAG TPA: SDR family oxidoreductase [Noviherbaspirillum sp.]|jgi:NAD(P)-dependent dehydrogenase (short-subunit alcohol dehydrogenase family)|uniref:SDR family oxidoreductase n=1 Tax=Noviherbaspirillum sp. TaxID=1926288 RepID=UPI002DDD0228|nr:SDR family oxidoreductase [Noviherbaspirillum sp.]HEV2609808.1 SDR family oxidoreductase [Noviherbaspirillum sp.]
MTAEIRKVALVTGAAKRIGRTIALALAGRGWDVAVHYRQSEQEARTTVAEIEALGRRAAAVQCDLADEAQARTLLADAAAALQAPVSCLVNNASLFQQDGAQDFSVASLDAHMHANLAAPIILTQALYQITPPDSRAVAINLLDQKLFNLNPDFLSYTLSKAALHTATTMLAQALAPRLRVVGVAPGITLVSGDQTEGGFAKAHAVTPLGRSSTPEDVAATVCFVAESPAITGTTLLVDGGQHLIPLQRDVMFLAK